MSPAPTMTTSAVGSMTETVTVAVFESTVPSLAL